MHVHCRSKCCFPECPDAPAALGMPLYSLHWWGQVPSPLNPLSELLSWSMDAGAQLPQLPPSSLWFFISGLWYAEEDAFLHFSGWGRSGGWRPELPVIPLRCSLRKPETPARHAQTHARSYHNNPTEFLIIYSAISMSPVTSREVRNSAACGISALVFLVWLLLI